MSALPPTTDMAKRRPNVRFVPQADIRRPHAIASSAQGISVSGPTVSTFLRLWPPMYGTPMTKPMGRQSKLSRMLLKQHHLSASQRLAKSRRQSIFLRAKPPISPLQASIAPATRQVINAFVAYGPQRQLSLDRASRRHGGVDAE